MSSDKYQSPQPFGLHFRKVKEGNTVAQYSNAAKRRSTIKKRKRTPAKFFKSPLRSKLAQENFCSSAKVKLADSFEHRYKVHTVWDWLTVALYLLLGLVALIQDVKSLLSIGQIWNNPTSFDGHYTPIISAALVVCIWITSFSTTFVALLKGRVPRPAQATGTEHNNN